MEDKDCNCTTVKQEDWDKIVHKWNRKAFYRTKHWVVFHMPIGIAKAIEKGMSGISDKGYTTKEPIMMLDEEIGRLKGQMLIEIEEIPREDDVVILEAGKIYSVYHKGPFKELSKVVKRLINFYKTGEEGRDPKRIFTWTTNCPDCWEKDGGPVTVMLAK